MRIVLCPDKFRGSATAVQAAAALARGIRRAASGAGADDAPVPVELPVADGGEGTVDVLEYAGWTRHVLPVRGPVGDPRTAAYVSRASEAVIELAQACGPATLARPAPLTASTYGVGQLVRAALDRGCRRIVLGLGGSATNDGGAGMLAALGAELSDVHGADVAPGGAGLAALARIDLSTLDPRIARTQISVATDVDNPLLGARGAVAVFAAQKGADADARGVLERGLRHFADVLSGSVGRDPRDEPGAGAAGGVGFGALAGLGADRVSGIDFVLAELGVADALAAADLVVVGEGRFDEQSLGGKAPVGVARLARSLGVPAVVVAGAVTVTADELRRHGIVGAWSLTELAGDGDRARSGVLALLESVGAQLCTDLMRR